MSTTVPLVDRPAAEPVLPWLAPGLTPGWGPTRAPSGGAFRHGGDRFSRFAERTRGHRLVSSVGSGCGNGKSMGWLRKKQAEPPP